VWNLGGRGAGRRSRRKAGRIGAGEAEGGGGDEARCCCCCCCCCSADFALPFPPPSPFPLSLKKGLNDHATKLANSAENTSSLAHSLVPGPSSGSSAKPASGSGRGRGRECSRCASWLSAPWKYCQTPRARRSFQRVLRSGSCGFSVGVEGGRRGRKGATGRRKGKTERPVSAIFVFDLPLSISPLFSFFSFSLRPFSSLPLPGTRPWLSDRARKYRA